MIRKKRMLITLSGIVIVAAITLSLLACWFWIEPADSLKPAISRGEISGSNYIICKRVAVTGFHWKVVEGGDASIENGYCNIVEESSFEKIDFDPRYWGSGHYESPVDGLNLGVEFWAADNTFVFYINDVHTYYSEEMKETITVYSASGWDILSPVKHGRIGSFFESKAYITTKDQRT